MEYESGMGLPPPPTSALPSSSATWVRGGCIGRGSFGTVSLAVDKSSGGVFAVKSVKLDSSSSLSAIQSLENEIRILRSLSSPYIVSYIGDETMRLSSTEAHRNLLMEYVPGGTVAEFAARCRENGGAIDESAVRTYARCVARALRYLHCVGVVHGDVKGRNVLVDPTSGEAKLADFGSARRLSGDGGDCWGGMEAAIDHARGTPLWMAPEVVGGEGTSPASDVWSLGCTVIEMVNGKPPWSESCHQDAGHVLLRIALGDETPEFPAQLSKSGRDFLDKCLRRNPAERWSCEQLLQHPFLAEAAVAAEQSPRSALEWANFGFDSSEEDEEEKIPATTIIVHDSSVDSSGDLRGRVRDLASDGETVWEDSDDWEDVRSVRPSISPCFTRDEAGDAGAPFGLLAEASSDGTPPQHADWKGCGWEDRGDDVSETVDGGQSDAARCPSPSADAVCSSGSCHCGCSRRSRVGSSWRQGDDSGSGANLMVKRWGRGAGFVGWRGKLVPALVSWLIHSLFLSPPLERNVYKFCYYDFFTMLSAQFANAFISSIL